ncbi:hypothetical protein Sste5346_007964 [Sporothrix stenoceras]|uniref:BTB domain-containing protein n=1 Tax=Sporothrix stenoceras TaxID=5173 RepID=A0ABR3YSQ8_9PEZI
MASDLLRVLVGPDHREFVVHRAMLCDSSPFFRDSIDAVPEGLTTPSSPSSSPSSSPESTPPPSSPSQPTTLIWLSGESADVFELFVVWLYRRHAFRSVVEDAVTILAREATSHEVITLHPQVHRDSHNNNNADSDTPPSASANLSDLHWHLVRLHLFAAIVDIPVLQDAVMDALQDLYLRFDWTATPALLRFLYIEADPLAACRLRKWAVALLGWTLANSGEDDHAELRSLLVLAPLAEEYDAHTRKMKASRADARIKNPQLRISSNQLRREDRHFGFRQCSFHSHRRSAGEGRCPHERARRRGTLDFVSSLALPLDMPSGRKSNLHSPSASLSSLSSTTSEPRLEDLPVWSPLSVTTPGYAPLGMESTI